VVVIRIGFGFFDAPSSSFAKVEAEFHADDWNQLFTDARFIRVHRARW
jgi:hypothetical protein